MATTASEALTKIKEALTNEIEIDVDPTLVEAFTTLEKFIEVHEGDGNTADAQTESTTPQGTTTESKPQAITLTTDQVDTLDDTLLDISSYFEQLRDAINAGNPVAIASVLTLISGEFGTLSKTFKDETTTTTTTATTTFGGFDVKSLEDYGEKLGFKDRNGKALRVGDIVKFSGSNRYGSGKAVVTAVGEGDYSSETNDRRRPKLRLEDGKTYEPSAGRVERLEKATA